MTASRPLVAGNWKMNGLKAAAAEFGRMIEGYGPEMRKKVELAVCPPATLLYTLSVMAIGSRIAVGGQDCAVAAAGAHTGDLSAEMLADAGAAYVIVGHSERRTDHGESDGLVRAKAQAVLRAGLTPIVCIGETEAERRNNETLAVVERQLAGSLPDGVGPEDVVVAYEPVWAIGTGLTPSSDDIAEVHAHITGRLFARFGEPGERIRILYGGSVKPANAKEILGIPHVSGALVGGASLKAADFLSIAAAYA